PSFAFPSIPTLWLAIDFFLFGREPHRRMRRFVLAAAGIVGLFLYAGLAGFVPIDVYRLGFSPFAPIVLALTGVFLARSHRAVAWLIAVALIADDLSLLRSRNLFDYLLDPAIVAIGLVRLSAMAVTAFLPADRDTARSESAAAPAHRRTGAASLRSAIRSAPEWPRDSSR